MNNLAANYNRYLSAIKKMSLERLFDIVNRRIINIPHTFAWYLPWGFSKKNKQKLSSFKNIHKGKRCFIIANGPSLNKIDFNLLKEEYTIGMNRIYLLEKLKNFLPTYLATVDEKCQIQQFYEEYNNLSIPVFINWTQRKLFNKKDNQFFLKVKFSLGFPKDIVKDKVNNGASVTFTCIQLAYYMGFSEVYLIGKDHSYNTNLKSGKSVISDGMEDNHFIKGYYKKGMVWASPAYDIEEYAYKLAKNVFDKDHKIIKDATIDGKLNVFDKVEFDSLFNRNI
ncbi:MAG: 6-hydroxymethylpterin diphosphokinase MptE-like protein [Bacteroidales bacterium]